MAINKESNGYIIGFSVVLVVVVGSLLAFVAMALQPYQKANVLNEKKQNILQAMGERDLERNDAGGVFSDYVVKRVNLSYKGEIIEGSEFGKDAEIDPKNERDPFNVDLLKEYKEIKDPAKRRYPLFVCDYEGKTVYVIPMMGQGLWAAVWGYVAIDSDFNIVGAVFDHKSETPGLGAEIATDAFETSFIGKELTNEQGEYMEMNVIKPGGELNPHRVDGISGGTFTSVGVQEMLNRTLVVYHTFLTNNPNYK